MALVALAAGAAITGACGAARAPQAGTVMVAAAANLTGVMDEVAKTFERETGARVVLSYGSTAQLARQIENGAPFDLFAAADTEHVDQLITQGLLAASSRAIYARGQLALWIPNPNLKVRTLADLVQPELRVIAIAQPTLAPYGEAAVQALTAAGVWARVRPKVVYANNINAARQYAISGNADAAFTALSLVLKSPGTVIKIDRKLHRPLDQALGLTVAGSRAPMAIRFRDFLLGPSGRGLLRASGYSVP